MDNEKTLNQYGFEISKKNDTTTTIFRKIKFVDLKANAASGITEREAQPFPSEDSLQFFVRTQCTVTNHEVDFVFVSAFKKKVCVVLDLFV